MAFNSPLLQRPVSDWPASGAVHSQTSGQTAMGQATAGGLVRWWAWSIFSTLEDPFQLGLCFQSTASNFNGIQPFLYLLCASFFLARNFSVYNYIQFS